MLVHVFWLVGWLVGWLVDWLVSWLVMWLVGWLVGWWLFDWGNHLPHTCLQHGSGVGGAGHWPVREVSQPGWDAAGGGVVWFGWLAGRGACVCGWDGRSVITPRPYPPYNLPHNSVQCFLFRVQGSNIQGSGFKVQGYMVYLCKGSGFRVQGYRVQGFWVQGFWGLLYTWYRGLRVQGPGFRGSG